MTRGKRKPRKQVASDPMEMPTSEQIRNGVYDRKFVTHTETNTKAMAHQSMRDPVLRWERDGKLTDQQAATIREMQTLWQLVYGTQRLIGRYSEPLAPSTSESSDARLLGLRDDLRRIEGYFDGVKQWYGVFEAVCRFGLTGPQACETNAVDERRARDKALVIVCFVADFIAAKERW